MYQSTFDFALTEGINYIEFPTILQLGQGTMVLLDMSRDGVVAVTNESSTIVRYNDQTIVNENVESFRLERFNQTDIRLYFQIIVVTIRYLYTNSQTFLVKFTNEGVYNMNVSVYENLTGDLKSFKSFLITGNFFSK